jgi:signal transduction histidine kinase
MSEAIPFPLLLASSVHDIKNSLGMLLSTLETVMQSISIESDQQRGQFTTLRSEAGRINNALIYLLGLYRLQQDQLPVQIQEVYVADFLDEQIATNQLLFDIRGLRVELQCDETLSAYFDPALIAGVMNNVLVNAAHYAHRVIEVKAARDGAELVIEVRDDGPGFPQKILQSVHNHAGGIDFNSGSTSLGLYFSSEVARLHRRGDHRGSIVLDNPEDGGSCFRLQLP